MRLKKIKLAGFKSFAQTTEIQLPGQLIGVVGPNGCGKSNVMDALRWVLGESKASALRGDSMQDVLFNGTAQRPPAERASVELLFDTQNAKIQNEWTQFAELSVKRILTRGGGSDYFINQIRVRRRDITDLFSGTGLGANAYAIIGQGTISNIIEAKPEELRVLIEEAAGVSRYKDRRRETENRLNDTKNHLMRLNDIAQNLNEQILSLEKQAHTAQIFNDLNKEKKETQNLLWRLRFQKAKNEEEHLKLERLDAQNAFEKHQTALTAITADIEKSREENYQVGEKLQSAQHQFYVENAKWLGLEQENNYLKKQKESVQNQLLIFNNNEEKLQKELSELLQKKETFNENIQKTTDNLKSLELQESESFEKIKVLENDFNEKQESFNHHQKTLLNLNQNFSLLSREKMHILENLKNIEVRFERLKTKNQKTFDEELLKQKQAELEIIVAEKNQIETQIFEKKNALTVENHHLNSLKKELNDFEKDLAQNLAQQKVLKSLGSGEKRSVLLESLQVTTGFEKALEAALNAFLFFVHVENLENAAAEKNGGFFENPKNAENIEISNDSLFHQIQKHGDFQAILAFWLKNVLVASSLEDALQRRHELKNGECFVTKNGETITQYSLFFFNQKNSALERQAHLKRLQKEAENFNQKIAELKNLVNNQNEKITKLTVDFKNNESELKNIENKIRSVEMTITKLQTEKNEIVRFVAHFENEKKLLEMEKIALNEKSQKNDLIINEESQKITTQKNILAENESNFELSKSALNEAKNLGDSITKNKNQKSFEKRELENRFKELENNQKRLENDLKNLNEEILKNKNLLNDLNQKDLQIEIQNALALKLKAENNLREVRIEAEEKSKALQILDEKRLQFTQENAPLQAKIADYQLKETRAADLAENIKTQFLENNENDEALLFEKIEGQHSISYLQNLVQNLTKKIADLGAVNLMALSELQKIKEKSGYLEQQIKDLNEAMETLESAIAKIDEESLNRFNETFHAVNCNFGVLFPEIFGAGSAGLELTQNEKNETGVLVYAKPPGKKNARLSMLSGGEKALCAIALIFAFFLLNPAPFCLLDEVDAPLDDANTERFCHLVKKMAQNTQFLFISHNKIAMTMAEQLVGVTMRELGVSRVVDVNIAQALKTLEGQST